MPTFTGYIAFDKSDAIPVGVIPKFEPPALEDQPVGYFEAAPTETTYSPYPGKNFPIYRFVYQSNPADLENASVNEETGILSKTFKFVAEVVWYKSNFFDVGKYRYTFYVVVVSKNADKSTNTNDTFYLNATVSEQISIELQPPFPSLSEAESQLVEGYYVETGVSGSGRRFLPANTLRIYTRVSGSYVGDSINFSGPVLEEFLGRLDIFGDPANFGVGVTYLPMLKTGFQVANGSTAFNIPFSISQEDIDNAITLGEAVGIIVPIGSGVGKVLFVTRNEVNIPDYQKKLVGDGFTDPWEGYLNGGIDGQYIKDALPLHFSLQPESAVDDFFCGALNVPLVRYGGSVDQDAFYNSPRFSYTRVLNSYVTVFIPKAEAVPGFSFYITAHVADTVSLFAARVDKSIIINTQGVNFSSGDFAFSPRSYFINSGLLIKNWMKQRIISGSNILESDPLEQIPAFSSSVVSEYAKPISFSDVIRKIRPISEDVDDANISSARSMRLIKTRLRPALPRYEKFPLGYFAAAERFAINFDGDQIIEGGIAYIDKTGNVDIIMTREQIRNKNWFDSFFSGLIINPVQISAYYTNSGNDSNLISLFYDNSPVCNSLIHDNAKIPYDHRLARALTQIGSFNEDIPDSGVGICALNLLSKRSTGEWRPIESSILKFPVPNSIQNENRFYYDMSESEFDVSSPLPYSIPIVWGQNSQPIRIGNGRRSGSLNMTLEWLAIAPVSLSSNGRIYYHPTEPVGGFTGQRSELNIPFVSTSPTSGKIASCIDFQGMHGMIVSSDSFSNDILKTFKIDGFLEAQKRRSYVDSMDYPSPESRTDSDDKSKASWYGMSIDSLPAYPKGSHVIRERNVQGSIVDEPLLSYSVINRQSKLSSRSVNYLQYFSGSWIQRSKQEKFFQISVPEDNLVEKISIRIKSRHSNIIENYKSFLNITMSGSATALDARSYDAILYQDVSISTEQSKDQEGYYSSTIIADINTNYYGGRITAFGGVLNDIQDAIIESELIVINKSSSEKYKTSALESGVCISADGRYIIASAISKDLASSIDLFVKENENGFWKRIENVVQSFSGDSFASVMVRFSNYSNKIFVSFSSYDCLFIKPVEMNWIDDASKDCPILFKENFRLNNGSLYGLSGRSYMSVIESPDVRTSYLSNRIRIKPSSYVYGENESFISQERIYQQNAVSQRFSAEVGDEIYPRYEIPPEVFSGSESTKSLYRQTASSPYSFEIMPDGSLLIVSVKDGGLIFRKSEDDGRSWRSLFSQFPAGQPFRPLKFLKKDRGSSVEQKDGLWTYSNGICPDIENVSTALDMYGQKLAISYSSRGMIFMQEIPTSMLLSDCVEYIKSMFTTDQRKSVPEGDNMRPLFVTGVIPAEYQDDLVGGLCDFEWRMAGPLSRENISAVGNMPIGSKAPAMIYLSSGAVRMHFENEQGDIMGMTITASSVRSDYIP